MACENMPLRFYKFSGLSPLPFMTPYVALGSLLIVTLLVIASVPLPCIALMGTSVQSIMLATPSRVSMFPR
jgi:hypothetical protein